MRQLLCVFPLPLGLRIFYISIGTFCISIGTSYISLRTFCISLAIFYISLVPLTSIIYTLFVRSSVIHYNFLKWNLLNGIYTFLKNLHLFGYLHLFDYLQNLFLSCWRFSLIYIYTSTFSTPVYCLQVLTKRKLSPILSKS